MTIKLRNERMRQVIALMKAHKKAFYMAFFINVPDNIPAEEGLNECNTSCCIAGFTCLVARPGLERTEYWSVTGGNPASIAKEFLGLDCIIAHCLFYGRVGTEWLPEGFNMNSTDVNLGIKALRAAVKEQNRIDKQKK